ncbi:hypothetical protein Lal_00024850 [Lupinus albus]|nr:hypothetical protein Lal_00024850 [Lupinus albus]
MTQSMIEKLKESFSDEEIGVGKEERKEHREWKICREDEEKRVKKMMNSACFYYWQYCSVVN